MSKIKSTLLKILGPLFLKGSTIVSNEKLSPHFHLLTIKSRSFKKAQWIPGQKIQVRLEQDIMRSYTPSSWDNKLGLFQTLVYMHGKGPGAVWARDVKEGASVIVLGPRSSLVLEEASSDILFFGDETTIGLASALKENKAASKLAFFFEANSLEESRLILQRFSLTESSLYPLLSHEKVAMDLKKSFDDNREATIILSGKQQSIVAIREKLYALGVPAEKIIIKVYWGWKDDPKGKLKK